MSASYAQGKRAMHKVSQLLVQSLLTRNGFRRRMIGCTIGGSRGQQLLARVQLGLGDGVIGKDTVVVGVEQLHWLVKISVEAVVGGSAQRQ